MPWGKLAKKLVKTIFQRLNLPVDDHRETIHDEFDLLSNGRKIEIKTARKGLKRNSFQFNGINPRYQYDLLILIGISPQSVGHRILQKSDIHYAHGRGRNYFAQIGENEKQLVKMNPNNEVNFKLTLHLKELENIENFADELKKQLALL